MRVHLSDGLGSSVISTGLSRDQGCILLSARVLLPNAPVISREAFSVQPMGNVIADPQVAVRL